MYTDMFLKLMSQRRSVRKFKTDPIDLEIVKKAILCAGTAPSGAHRQPWHFIVVTDQTIKQQIRAEAEKVENNFYQSLATKDWVEDLKFLQTNSSKPYLTDAPILIITFMKLKCDSIEVEHKTQKAYYPKESVGLAVGLLLAALHGSGLGTLTHTPQPMEFLNQIFNLDKSYVPFMIVVTGRTANDYVAPQLKRKSLDEICTIY